MTTPNNMPKRPNPVRQKVVGDLIHTVPTSWTRKTVSRDEDGKEIIENVRVNQHALRYPLAQNVSAENVERLAKKWLN